MLAKGTGVENGVEKSVGTKENCACVVAVGYCTIGRLKTIQ
jgi:hypothetical protein